MARYYSQTINGVTFSHINNDYYGSPRYVFHFLNLSDSYERAINLANQIGGRKYTAKWYGGGIVISSYNLQDTANKIKSISENKERFNN